MVPIMGKPLLEKNIERLKKYGVDEVVLSTYYKSKKIQTHFEDGRNLGVKTATYQRIYLWAQQVQLKRHKELF